MSEIDAGAESAVPEREILSRSIEDELRQSYLDYAMSVIVSRALPDVRDGLKPVHRRVLFAMGELGITHNRPTRKSAYVVGEVMGKYHPHGDSAIYETIVRMAQDFMMRYPLVYGQGNFGSIDRDPPAHQRYTEARMTRIAGEMLADLDKETADTVPNYDETLSIPVVLPTRVPNLLVNGQSGIAVGMATNIPPHNLTEVVDACLALLENPGLSVDELMTHIIGPGFPHRRHRQRTRRHRQGVSHRARAHFRPLSGDGGARRRHRPATHRRHRNTLPSKQSPDDRADRRVGEGKAHRGASARFATNRTRTGCAS